ncbi:hypothetical protein M413DRAFT_28232 [Hebeloma cylindrosporum]|uniref:Uncharacterized protein n=1 Tax=Hebeloma cylindrosporum TaxID=76867 RepID=A0A0C2YJH3_HEBCY|nr:hypothetical protein M413DRAFT_28232 [Hebeloma cylindrosporum h7]
MSLPDIMELPLARCGGTCGGRRIIATPPNAYRLHSHGEISYETQGGKDLRTLMFTVQLSRASYGSIFTVTQSSRRRRRPGSSLYELLELLRHGAAMDERREKNSRTVFTPQCTEEGIADDAGDQLIIN